MWYQGKENVERELEILLKKISETIPTILENSNEYNSLNEENNDYEELNSKEDILKQIIVIIEWFKRTESTEIKKIYENIILYRSQSILETIKR